MTRMCRATPKEFIAGRPCAPAARRRTKLADLPFRRGIGLQQGPSISTSAGTMAA